MVSSGLSILRTALAALVVGAATTLMVAGPVRADDFVDRVNAEYSAIPRDKRSDLVILPLMLEWTDPPRSVASAEDAALLPADSANWPAAAEWASSDASKALLGAIKTVTQETDFRRGYVFAQPYGIEAVAGQFDLIGAGLYTELGDPPTLADAHHLYMSKMRRLESLAHVEATRRASEGDVAGAIDGMIDWLMFSRQFADREFLEETRWAFESMRRASERIRDLAYEDSRADRAALTDSALIEDLERLAERGYIGLDRLELPKGNVIAAEQLVRRVIEPKGKPIPGVFGQNMARIAASERPLRLFSEAAYWDSIVPAHAAWYESLETLERVGNGWVTRWSLGAFDPIFTTDSDYTKASQQGTKFAVIVYLLRGIEDLFPMRQKLRAELAGVRTSLGLYGYNLRFGGTGESPNWPPASTSIRPAFVPQVDSDPYSRSPRALSYFIPVKDTPQGPRGELVPWEIQAFPPGHDPFKIPFRDGKVFILYSVGLDETPGYCKFATQADPEAREGDYLLWPPMLSLVRQRLIDAGIIR